MSFNKKTTTVQFKTLFAFSEGIEELRSKPVSIGLRYPINALNAIIEQQRDLVQKSPEIAQSEAIKNMREELSSLPRQYPKASKEELRIKSLEIQQRFSVDIDEDTQKQKRFEKFMEETVEIEYVLVDTKLIDINKDYSAPEWNLLVFLSRHEENALIEALHNATNR